MVTIAPFQGFRYNKDKAPDLQNTVAPPYDVINPELQKTLHDASPYNIAHIIKGKKFEGDSSDNNEFTRAADHLTSWIDNEVLKREDAPAIYILAQDFEVEGEHMTRTGFVALVRLEEMCAKADVQGTCSGVHQHEETLPKDIEDRLNLLRATRGNFGLIFSIYSDSERRVDNILESRMKEEPLVKITDHDGITHKLWAIKDKDDIAKIQEVMRDKYIIIADGHHRYKTALKYSREHPDSEASKYRMLAFVNTMNKGLVVLPTHRLVQGVEGFDCGQLISALSEDFAIEEFEFGPNGDLDARDAMFRRMREHFDSGKHALGLYCKNNRYYSLVLKNEHKMDGIQNHSDAWKHLDVTILHKLVLEDQLGIDKEKLAAGTIEGGSFVEYIKAIGDAVQKSVDKVNEKGYQAVFFMNPTRVAEVEEVATNHETMPQKSTFFYPKVYTGFVVHRLE
ncbi:MAG: DUF1015 domain-containing protein [Thermoplasmata archaeon]|nr:MAG: DUF1015 domain-containing protein [Thermoplasmata archaeon]